MKIEYIIEGDSFKKFIRGKISTKKDGVTIKYTTNNVIGQNNYILSVTATGKNDEISRCLSQKSEQINEILMSNDIKFYTLRDDPSAYFAEKLYPLVSECENKIRKFVYITLFDLDEASNKTTFRAIKKLADIKEKEKLSQSFLNKLTLGEIFTFLFDNSGYVEQAKSILEGFNKKKTKKELIERLENIEIKTVWSSLYEDKFPDFDLQSNCEQIEKIRNSVMHFHTITYDKYVENRDFLQKYNKKIEEQLSKGIVIETTPENIELLSRTSPYTISAINSILGNGYPTLNSAILETTIETLGDIPRINKALMSSMGIISDRFSESQKIIRQLPLLNLNYTPIASAFIRGEDISMSFKQLDRMRKIIDILPLYSAKLADYAVDDNKDEEKDQNDGDED